MGEPIQGTINLLDERMQNALSLFAPFQNIYIAKEEYWLDYLNTTSQYGFDLGNYKKLIQWLSENGWIEIVSPQLIYTQPLLRLLISKTHRNEYIELAFLRYYEQQCTLLYKYFESKSQEVRGVIEFLEADWCNILNAIQLAVERERDIIIFYKLITEYWGYYHENQKIIDYSLNLLEKYTVCKSLYPRTYLKILEILGHSYYALNNYDKAWELCGKSLTYYQEKEAFIANVQMLGRIYQNLGTITKQFQDYEGSIQYIKRAIDIFKSENIKGALASAYQALATTYLVLKKHSESVKYYQAAEKLYIEIDEKGSLDSIYHNLGLLHERLRQYDRSKYFYLRASKFCIQYGNQKGLAQAYNNLGTLAWDKREYDETTDYYKKAISIYILLGNFHKQAKVYQNLGLIAARNKFYKDAEFYYKNAIKLFERIHDERQVGQVMLNYGVLSYKMKNYDLSEHYLLDTVKIFEKYNDKLLIATAYLNLGILYKHNGSLPSKSRDYQIEATKMLEQTEDYDKLSRAYYSLGILDYGLSKVEQSIVWLNKSIETAQKTNNQYQIGMAFQNLAVAFLHQKDYGKSKYCALESWKRMCRFLPHFKMNKLEEIKMRLKLEANLEIDFLGL